MITPKTTEKHAILYDLLYSKRYSDALAVTFENREKARSKKFFLTYSEKELRSLLEKVCNSDVLLSMGFSQSECKVANTILAVHYCSPDFVYKDVLEKAIPGFEDRLRKSRKIKNKEFPFMDLHSLLKGYEVKKVKI